MTVDVSALRALRNAMGGSDDDLMEVIESFIQEASGLVRSLRTVEVSTNFDSICRITHSLKPNCEYFGMFQASEMLSRIESLCADGTVPHEEIGAACNEVEDGLRTLEAILSEGKV